jgi:uncharacterized phage protein (TIGR01671 family)
MRKIKFRAWDKENKIMIDWSCINQTAFNNINILYEYKQIENDYEKFSDIEKAIKKALNTGNHIKQSFLYKIFHNPNLILMQYTDLKDKNGKEIYENDIVQYCDENIGIVKYDLNFVEFNCGDHYNNFLCKNNEEFIKIIGNIYENKELLNERN